MDQSTNPMTNKKIRRKRGSKIKRYLMVLWPLLVLILISLLYTIGLGVVFGIIVISAYVLPDIAKGNIVSVFLASRFDPNTINAMLLMIPLQLIWAAVFYLWYRKVVIIKPEITRRCLQKKNLMLLVLLTVGSNLFISGALDLIFPYLGEVGEEYNELMNEMMEGNIILSLISSLVLAPIAEELICRGIILKKAREAFPFAVANIIQALIFGIIHGNIIQGTYAFVIGLILGYVAYTFDSILPAILIHFMLNLLGGFLSLAWPVTVQILEVILGAGIIIYAVRILGKLKLHQAKVID